MVLAHAIQQAGSLIGTHGGEEIQAFGQAARLIHGAHVAPDHLSKDILIQGKALAHEAETLGNQRLILLDPDPHRVDLRRRKGFGGLLETGKQAWVCKLTRIGILTEDLVRKRTIFDVTQVIRFANDEDGRLVDIFPQTDGRSPAGDRGRAQRLHQKQGPAGFEIIRLAEGQAPVPHHRLEIHLQIFTQRVMAAWDVLGVIFDQAHILRQVGAIPDRRKSLGIGGVDESQLGVCHGIRLGRGRVREAQQPVGHLKIGSVAQGGISQRSGFQRLVLGRGGSQHTGGEGLEIADEVAGFQVAQHLVENQVINVVNRVGGDEERHRLIAVLFIYLVELAVLPRHRRSHGKAILHQQGALRIAQGDLVKPLHLVQIQRQAVAPALEGLRQADSRLAITGKRRRINSGRRR